MTQNHYRDLIRENLKEGEQVCMKTFMSGWEQFTIETLGEDSFTVAERYDPIDYGDVEDIDI